MSHKETIRDLHDRAARDRHGLRMLILNLTSPEAMLKAIEELAGALNCARCGGRGVLHPPNHPEWDSCPACMAARQKWSTR